MMESRRRPSGEMKAFRGPSVAVAAQPPLFCEILSRQLGAEPGIRFVGHAANEDETLKLLSERNPQILLFDYEGLGPNGESTIHRLRHAAPGTRILVLATRSGDDTVERVLRAGASGLVGKQLDYTLLVRAIKAVAAGEIWANRRVTSLALEKLTGLDGGRKRTGLTKREQQIADACGRGLRNKEIGSLLKISTKTVKSHLNNIFRKLGVDSRLALGLKVIDRDQPKT